VNPWAWLEASIVEREAVLLAVRDLVVLVLVVGVGWWIARQLRKHD
jgi:hypothetical protein